MNLRLQALPIALAGFAFGATIGFATLASAGNVPTQADIAHALKFRGIPTLGKAPKPPSNPAMVPAKLPSKPLAATSAPAHPMISFSTIHFAFDSSRLTPDSIATLRNLGNALNQQLKDEKKFLIEGHTDAHGSPSYNMALSRRRADAVKEYLVHVMQVSAKRLETIGKGVTEPINPKNPYDPANRRVVVINLGAS